MSLAMLAGAGLLTALAAAPAGAIGTGGAIGTSGAIGTGGANGFGVAPAPNSQGRAAPYFSLNLAAGQSATSTAEVLNLGQHTEVLALTPSLGVTAANGGAAYEVRPGPCHGAACWVSRLPHRVTVAAGAKELVSFDVRVPPGTHPGQYLAGVTVEPAARPKPVPIGSRHGAHARAIIVRQISVGVAVTVGRLAALHTAFRIHAVTGQHLGTLPRLSIGLANTGQTFARAVGHVTCTAAGRPDTFRVTTATVLPAQTAQIVVNGTGLPLGSTVPCTVLLRYGAHQSVHWSGQVSLPAPPSTRIVHTGPGAYSVVPTGPGLLPWLIALLVVGVLILTGLALLLRRRRPTKEQ